MLNMNELNRGIHMPQTEQVTYATISEVQSGENRYGSRSDVLPAYVNAHFANIEGIQVHAKEIAQPYNFMRQQQVAKRYFLITRPWLAKTPLESIRAIIDKFSDFTFTKAFHGRTREHNTTQRYAAFTVNNGDISYPFALEPELCDLMCSYIELSDGRLTLFGETLIEQDANVIRHDVCAAFLGRVREQTGASEKRRYYYNNIIGMPSWYRQRMARHRENTTDYGPQDSSVELVNHCLAGKHSDPSYAIPDPHWEAVGKKGVKKVLTQIRPVLGRVFESSPLHYYALFDIFQLAGRVINDVAVSKIINAHFAGKEDAPSVIAAVNEWFLPGVPEGVGEGDDKPFETWNAVLTAYNQAEKAFVFVPTYYEARKQALKSKGGSAIAKLTREVGSLSVNKDTHPITHAAISDGRLPLGTFFRKSEQYFPFNQNWDLWEEMLTRYPEDAVELANTVTGRSTYEKDLMSYFWFVLYELPEYLERHTGKKWTVRPRIVQNVSDLEPPTEGQSSIQRKRSALTPDVDNEKLTVDVPYASIVLSGAMTTYTYGLDFCLLKRGFTFNGNVCTRELEEKLNGRDDYGLMFYTLTGSATGRGYPTFLIIFERREKSGDTHVHFHRVHPSRSKQGDYNPIDQWTATAWNWMHGNISADRIVAQQGDFVLNQTDKQVDVSACTLQQAYDDSHRFSRPVPVLMDEGSSDKYRIGWVVLDRPVKIKHHEHNDVTVPRGTYEMRQIRSWEANPVAVWTRTID